MSSSSESLHEFARGSGSASDLGFTVILVFDYYDGPEHGLALYPSGEGVRFSSLGDSKSRLFRAFEFIPIEGNCGRKSKRCNRPKGLIRHVEFCCPLRVARRWLTLSAMFSKHLRSGSSWVLDHRTWRGSRYLR